MSNWKTASASILDRIDVRQEVEAAGLKITGPIKDDGFAECRAVGRQDDSPSACIHLVPGSGLHGWYYDSRPDQPGAKGWSFFELVRQLKPEQFADHMAVKRHYAAQTGVELPGHERSSRSAGGKNGAASGIVEPSRNGTIETKHTTATIEAGGKGGIRSVDAQPSSNGHTATTEDFPLSAGGEGELADIDNSLTTDVSGNGRVSSKSLRSDHLAFQKSDYSRGRAFTLATTAKPAIKPESLKAFDVQAAVYLGKYKVLVFPGRWFRERNEKPVGFAVRRQTFRDFEPHGNYGKLKIRLIGGSESGWFASANFDELQTAHTIIRCEGITDALATHSAGPPAGCAVISGLKGARPAGENFEIFRGKKAVVICDADKPGLAGGEKFAAKCHEHGATEVRVVQLPFEVAENHGRDAYDYFSDSKTWADLEALIAKSPILSPKANEPTISNAIVKRSEDGTEVTPLPIHTVAELISEATDDWPRRYGNMLFVDDPTNGISDLANRDSLFAWLGASTKSKIDWYNSTGCVARAEYFEHLRRTSPKYVAVEKFPHEPRIPDHYYSQACDIPEGDGETLQYFLSRFNPETEIDKDLILAFFVTLLWGGTGGSRPVFNITSGDGRGSGKTKLAEIAAYIYGGNVPLTLGEDVTIVRQRLLSPDARAKRVIVVDNIKSYAASSADIEALITAPSISGKQMYVGESTRPNTLTWVFTLNGVSLCTDLAQRSVIIRVKKPAYNASFFEDSLAFIDANRAKLIGDAINFLRSERYPLPSYSRWGSWENDVLSRLPEPVEAQRVILERQQAADVEGEELDTVEERFAEELAKLDYNVDLERIRIPSSIICRWFCAAVNESHKATAVSRRINQGISEGRIKRLEPNLNRQYGRGFIWTGTNTNKAATPKNDIETRIEFYQKDQRLFR